MENKSYAVPIIVTIAIIIIVGAFYFYQGPPINSNSQTASIVQSLAPLLQPAEDVEVGLLRAIDSNDLLWGKTSAPVKLVIYSDLECPACAWTHNQFNQLSDYVEEGKVAMALRHFPLDSIHPHARKLAEAAVCAGNLGGNEKFWQFVDFIFAAPDKSSESLISDAIVAVGLDQATMINCQMEEKTKDSVESEYQEAISLGAQGTPFIIMIGPDNLTIPLFGGREVEDVRQAIDIILSDKKEPGSNPEIEAETEETVSVS